MCTSLNSNVISLYIYIFSYSTPILSKKSEGLFRSQSLNMFHNILNQGEKMDKMEFQITLKLHFESYIESLKIEP